MNENHKRFVGVAGLAAVALPLVVRADDWPFWGRTPERNAVSGETGILDTWGPGDFKQGSEEIDLATAKNVKWVAKMGSQTYGNPTAAGGKVFIGTNNELPRDPEVKGDRGILLCLDEKTGKLAWQLAVPKLGTGKISDWEYLGLCSSPSIVGDKVYIVTNRNEVMCLDINGMADGNAGPFTTEAQYKAGPGKPPAKIGPQDADIIWTYSMREEPGVFPHNITNCGPLVFGDKVVVSTSNGVDWAHTNIPNPKAPTLVMLDRNTGKLLGEEDEGISSRTLHSNWSTPSHGVVNGKDIIIFGGGDGWCYGFSTDTKKVDDRDVLQLAWKFDANLPQYRVKAGKPLKYATYDGPSEVIATPVFYKGKVYVPIGQDPEHGEGVGNFSCIDPTKSGDITTSGKVWNYDKIHRSLATAAIYNDMIFEPDFSGFIHCLDANTGKPLWVYDTKSHVWGSPLVVDNKVYVGTEDGDVIVLDAAKTMKVVNKIDMKAPIYSSPIVANGTLYVATQTHLYAIGKP